MLSDVLRAYPPRRFTPHVPFRLRGAIAVDLALALADYPASAESG